MLLAFPTTCGNLKIEYILELFFINPSIYCLCILYFETSLVFKEHVEKYINLLSLNSFNVFSRSSISLSKFIVSCSLEFETPDAKINKLSFREHSLNLFAISYMRSNL